MKKKRKPLPPHWYKNEIRECPICWRGTHERVRQFTPAPPKLSLERWNFEEVYDWCEL